MEVGHDWVAWLFCWHRRRHWRRYGPKFYLDQSGDLYQRVMCIHCGDKEIATVYAGDDGMGHTLM